MPAFATTWQSVAPATPRPGNEADLTGLTLASAVAETVGDVIARYYVSGTTHNVGLRGGKFQFHSNSKGYVFELTKLQWTNNLLVSGKVDWNQIDGTITANVTLKAAGHNGAVTIAWNDRETDAKASLSGHIDGQTLEAERLAP